MNISGVLASAPSMAWQGVAWAAAASARGSSLLAQEYTVAAEIPRLETGQERQFIHDPGMTILPSGRILVAAPCWGPFGRRYVIMSRSGDGGRSWEPLDSLRYDDATPFVAKGRLHMFVQPRNWGDVYLARSEDEGETWTKAAWILAGRYWNCSTAMVFANDRLYWALGASHAPATEGAGWQGVAAIKGELSRDLLDPGAWQISGLVTRPATPRQLTRERFRSVAPPFRPQWSKDIWLEPNVVLVHGQLRVLVRLVIDDYGTSGLCGVCDLADKGSHLDLKFGQFYPLPGGQNKFFILYDETSRLFWMLSNLVADSQDVQGNLEKLARSGFRGAPGNERRFLMLSYSLDALNWFPAGCAARWPGVLQSFMYPSAAIDGDDIVFISRTSKYGRDQHDADLVTFHRIRNFRSLAMEIRPAGPAFDRQSPASEGKNAGSRSRPLDGRWLWHDGLTVSIAPGGDLSGGPGGRWELMDRSGPEYRFKWEGADGRRVETMRASPGGDVLEGKNAAGDPVWAVRHPARKSNNGPEAR